MVRAENRHDTQTTAVSCNSQLLRGKARWKIAKLQGQRTKYLTEGNEDLPDVSMHASVCA